jgi:hypothetical protein
VSAKKNGGTGGKDVVTKNPPGVVGRGAPQQPLSGSDYAKIGGLLLGIGGLLLVAFVLLAHRLLPAGILDQFYYIVVIIFGLVAAVVLFGVMRSYATLTVKRRPNLVLELGGPVVVAFLVVVGGFKLVPHGTSFAVFVRPHADGLAVIPAGKVRLEYGTNAPVKDIYDGEAEFREIPQAYSGQAVKILPEIEGYESRYVSATLDPSNPVIDIVLVKSPLPSTVVTGSVRPMPSGKIIAVMVEGESGEATPDRYGRFSITVHKRLSERARFSVWVDGAQVYDDYQVLSGEVILAIKKK